MKNNQKQFESHRYDQDYNPNMGNATGSLNVDKNQRNNESGRDEDNRMETGKHASQMGRKFGKNDIRIY